MRLRSRRLNYKPEVTRDLNLRVLRKTHNYSQEELAKVLGVDQAVISRLERGNQVLSMKNLKILTRIYKLNTQEVNEIVLNQGSL